MNSSHKFEVQHFEHSNATKLHDRILFNSYSDCHVSKHENRWTSLHVSELLLSLENMPMGDELKWLLKGGWVYF